MDKGLLCQHVVGVLQYLGVCTRRADLHGVCVLLYVSHRRHIQLKASTPAAKTLSTQCMPLTWRKRSKGRVSEGVPDSSTARAAARTAAAAASVCGASGARSVVRRLWLSSRTTTCFGTSSRSGSLARLEGGMLK